MGNPSPGESRQSAYRKRQRAEFEEYRKFINDMHFLIGQMDIRKTAAIETSVQAGDTPFTLMARFAVNCAATNPDWQETE